MKKKASYSVETLAKWFVLIGSVVIILYFLLQFDFTGDMERKTCAASVALRANSASSTLKIDAKNAFDLECYQKKICFVMGSSSEGCNNLGKNYTKVDLNGNKDEILDYIVTNMHNWHTDLGSGKLNYMPRGEAGANTFCFLNSVISADAKTHEAIKKQGNITYWDLWNKMLEKQTSEDKTYFEDLYGSNNLAGKGIVKHDGQMINVGSTQIDLSKTNFVMTEIAESGNMRAWYSGSVAGIAGGVFVGTVTLVSLPASAPTILIALAVAGSTASAGVKAGVFGYYLGSKDPNDPRNFEYIPPFLVQATKESLSQPVKAEDGKTYKCDYISDMGG